MIVRRDFLKLSGLFSAAMLVGGGAALELKTRSIETELQGLFYRGTSDGKIYVSQDAGKTWTLHTGFGSHLSISHLYVDFRKRLMAVLDCQGYDFKLALQPDGHTWRTV